MSHRKQLDHAARTILIQCLALPPESELAIVCDETTLKLAEILARVAEELNHRVNVMYFRSAVQRQYAEKTLGVSTKHALGEVAGTILCLNGSAECLGFREQIRRAAWGRGHRVAHMPGANWESFLAADADYARLTQHCQDLALTLAKGSQVSLETWDQKGRAHQLTAKLAPWERLPVISDGVIRDGAWGNVPSGETYIAPLEETAHGSIVINGSLPGLVLMPRAELVLHFRQGRLTHVEPNDSPAARHLFDTQLHVGRNQNDPNWNNLAEIGLGANEQITALTGVPLLDEKMYGTAHIALGDSTDMGGMISSLVHCDMVCTQPHVRVDGKSILSDGEIVVDPAIWREDYRALRLPHAWANKKLVRRTVIEASVDARGRLRRQWDASSGGVCSLPVGDDQSALRAAELWQFLKQNSTSLALHQLGSSFDHSSPSQTNRLVYLLERYGLVETI